MSIFMVLGAVHALFAASGGAAHAIGYVVGIVLVLVVLPIWLIRRRKRR